MKQGSLAHKLRLLRAERGLTLVQASALTGVTRGTLSELEGGKRVAYMPTLSKIAEGYGVDVRELLLEKLEVSLAGKADAPPETGQPEEEERAEKHRRRTYLVAHRIEIEKCADNAEELTREFTETLSVGGNPIAVAERVGRLMQLAEEAHRRAKTADWLFLPLKSMAQHMPEYRLPDWERSLVAEINEQFARIQTALTVILDRARDEEQAYDIIEELEPVAQEVAQELGQLHEALASTA
jgi:transcriptional regulator with XRE-family HTH domain